MGRPRTWTDDDLRRELPRASSWTDLRNRLGMVGGGSTTGRLRERCAELGLDASHLPQPGQMPRRWTDQELAEAVAASTNLFGVFKTLDLAVGGSAWRRMQEHIVGLGLDTSHWTASGVQPGRPRRAPKPIDDGRLRELLPVAQSLAQVIAGLGLDPQTGSAYRRVKKRIAVLGLSTDHLAGQAWAKDRNGERPDRRRPLEEILVRNSSWKGGSSSLRDRLIDEGILAWHCALCGIEEWQGKRAPLQLDHINGDPSDNRIENLRLLCPNCHAQTPTYCGRNIGNGYSAEPRTP